MKKSILLATIAVVASLTVVTSAKAQKGIYAGAQGVAQVNIMFNESDANKPGADYKSKLGSSFGLSGGYNFTKNMGVGVEVMYSTMKQRYSDNTVHFTQKFNYLKIPVVFTYNSNPDRKFMFTAKAGPQLGILLKSDISKASDTKLNGNATSQYEKLTLGAMIGTGVRMRLTEKMFLDAGVRFDGSFTNTEKKSHHGYTTGRTSSHDINAGLEMGIKYFF